MFDVGDNVGGLIFEFGFFNDEFIIDVFNVVGVDVNVVGNYEFDKGWKDLVECIVFYFNSFYFGVNVYEKGIMKVVVFFKVLMIIVKDGVCIGVVGVVIYDLFFLVFFVGIFNFIIGDLVKVVNVEVKCFKSEGLVDVVVVEYYEGVVDGFGDVVS